MNRKFILIIFCCLLLSCSVNQLTEQNIILVKVPPIYDEKLSREENYYRFQRFLFPQLEVPNPIPKGLPNDDSLLFLSVDQDGKIELNQEDAGNISETRFLTDRLTTLFQEREKAGAYEPGNQKIVRTVGITVANPVKYGDFIKVVDAVRQSGAEPIVLLFDNDARPKFKTNLLTNTKIK